MKYFVTILMALASFGLKAQTPGDILEQVVQSAGITFPTINALGQDPYNALAKSMASSRIGLSANRDSSSFYLAVNMQGTSIAQGTNWTQDILSGTSITVTPGFSHISTSGTESDILFTMIDPISGFPSVNPLTGGPITIPFSINTGFNIGTIPFASMGLGYRANGHYAEFAYLPVGRIAPAVLPSTIGLGTSSMWRFTAGGSQDILPGLKVNYQYSMHGMNMFVFSSMDTVATIEEEGQIFVIENQMESFDMKNRLHAFNAGLSYDLGKRTTIEVGAMYYRSTFTMDQKGPIILYLETVNPIDGSGITAQDELLDVLDGSLSSSGVNPYLSVQFHQKKHHWSLTLLPESVSLLYIL